jgi:hypothetical protein
VVAVIGDHECDDMTDERWYSDGGNDDEQGVHKVLPRSGVGFSTLWARSGGKRPGLMEPSANVDDGLASRGAGSVLWQTCRRVECATARSPGQVIAMKPSPRHHRPPFQASAPVNGSHLPGVSRTDLNDGTVRYQFRGAAAEQLSTALDEQRTAFIAKFGRAPGPEDPVFFDPDANEPRPVDPTVLRARMLEAMRSAGVPDRILFAVKTCDRIITTENVHLLSDQDIAEWNAALALYDATH